MKIKIIITCFLLCSFAIKMYGQTTTEKDLYLTKIEKYRKMKSTGAALTVVGGLSLVAGVVILSGSSIEYVDYGNGVKETKTHGNPGAGAALFLIGAAGLGSGIPLCVIGSKKQKKFQDKLNSLSAKFDINQRSSGVALIYRF